MNRASLGVTTTLSQFFSYRGFVFITRLDGSAGSSTVNGAVFGRDFDSHDRQIGIFESPGRKGEKRAAVLRVFGSDKLEIARKWADELSGMLNFRIVVELASVSPRYCRNFDLKAELNKTRWAWIGAMSSLSVMVMLILAFMALVIPTLNFSSPFLAVAIVIRALVFIIFHV